MTAKTRPLAILFILAFALVPVVPASLSVAQRVRTEDSAVTPAYASWHQKDNDRIMADLKKRNGDVGLLLVGDSITALWPKKGPKSYSAFLPWKPLNVAISAEHAAVNYADLAQWANCIVDTRNVMATVNTKAGQVWKA